MQSLHQNIPIVFATDENYAQYVAITILSCIENSSEFLDFYILVPKNIKKKALQYFECLKQKANCNINIIYMNNYFKNCKMKISHITYPTYYRLVMADVLPKTYDKCIYLDADIIIRKDLKEYFNIDLKDNYIAGVKAAGYHLMGTPYAKSIQIPNISSYINAGATLWNLKKIRQDNLTPYLVKLAQQNYSSQDQDVINIAFFGHIQILPLKYNFMRYQNQELINKYFEQNIYTPSEFKEAQDNSVIIHYADKIKPWKDPEIYLGYEWLKFALKYEKLQQQYSYNKLNYEKKLQKWYRTATGKKLNLKNPKTFNEKIQWLKLYDSTPIKTLLADKYLVRDWVKEKIGEKYLIPCLGVYDSFNDIDFSKLPDKFVIKCNHGSGWNIIVKDKSQLDLKQTQQQIDLWMEQNFAFQCGYEMHYYNIPPKIIIEQYMEDSSGELRDYKFTCFNGKPEFIWIDEGRFSEHKRNLYDLDWNLLPYQINTKYQHFESPQKPECLPEMLQLAEKLSSGFLYVRTDFYVINNKVYFGEMTFTSGSGSEDIFPKSFDKHLSQKLELPKMTYSFITGNYSQPRKGFFKQLSEYLKK